MALGAQVIEKTWQRWFYISSLFEVIELPVFRKAIEMGSIYITIEYQQNLCHFFFLERYMHVCLKT